MKKKGLIIILIIFIILLVGFFIIKPKFQKTDSNNKNSNNSKNNSYSNVNMNGENSGIYVGVNEENLSEETIENFIYFSITIDKTVSKENQIKALISEISSAICYKIDINNIEIDGNKIKIDLSKNSAPFELENSYTPSDDQKYFITSKLYVAKTIFDSINKTLKSYFGYETEVYFSADSENIELESISIDSSKPY